MKKNGTKRKGEKGKGEKKKKYMIIMEIKQRKKYLKKEIQDIN